MTGDRARQACGARAGRNTSTGAWRITCARAWRDTGNLAWRATGTPAWLLACAVAAAGALAVAALPGTLRVALDWQPALALSQPWRAVTAAWVHLSALHLAANLLGTTLVAALGALAGCGPRAVAAWALAWPLTQLGLLLSPTLLHYGGLSGVLHAAVAVSALHLLRHDHGPRRAVGAALCGGLVLKLLLEAPWGPQAPARQFPGWDIAIAPLAHTTGALAGWLGAALLDGPDRGGPSRAPR